jgi:hypothetical protein
MRRRSQSYWLMGSAMLCEIQTVTDKTRDAAVSARPSRVSFLITLSAVAESQGIVRWRQAFEDLYFLERTFAVFRIVRGRRTVQSP